MNVNSHTKSNLADILSKHEAKLIADWVNEQSAIPNRGGTLPKESELRDGMRGVYRNAAQVAGK